jgi:small subunit ribosomal protein S20
MKTKSAKKALRQSLRRKKQNLWRKSRLKDAIKNYKKLIQAGKLEEAQKYLSEIYKFADKTAKTKTIKKGKANRIKSRMSHLLPKTSSSKASS